jgi:hypothetical protein
MVEKAREGVCLRFKREAILLAIVKSFRVTKKDWMMEQVAIVNNILNNLKNRMKKEKGKLLLLMIFF